MLGASLGAYTNGRCVARFGISRMIGFGTLCLATGGVASLIAALLGAGVIGLVASCMVYIFGIGFLFANAVARTLSRFPTSTGAASSVFGVNQFLIGGIVAALLSLVVEPTPLPLVMVVAACGAMSVAVWWGWLGRLTPVPD
jgi:DHA1 family bicyclomycin/chloramphenicol resistance-like MFS transporter